MGGRTYKGRENRKQKTAERIQGCGHFETVNRWAGKEFKLLNRTVLMCRSRLADDAGDFTADDPSLVR